MEAEALDQVSRKERAGRKVVVHAGNLHTGRRDVKENLAQQGTGRVSVRVLALREEGRRSREPVGHCWAVFLSRPKLILLGSKCSFLPKFLR